MRDWIEFQDDRIVRKEVSTKDDISKLIDGARLSANDPGLTNLSYNNRFIILYSAARKWCDIVIRAEGWRAQGTGAHEAMISGFAEFLGENVGRIAEFLDKCRKDRGSIEYEGEMYRISEVEVDELGEIVTELESIILAWLMKNHPGLYPG